MGLFVTWEVNGDIPDNDVPLSAPNTKNAAAQAQFIKLLQDWQLGCLLDDNPDPTPKEFSDAETATMDRSYRSHYNTVTQFSAGICTLLSRSISPLNGK